MAFCQHALFPAGCRVVGPAKASEERSKNNLRKFIAGLGKRGDSIDQLSQIVFETFQSEAHEAVEPIRMVLCLWFETSSYGVMAGFLRAGNRG